ncbi:MAG: hypothetical protein ACLRWP_09015 [Bilophila wadsworthia]
MAAATADVTEDVQTLVTGTLPPRMTRTTTAFQTTSFPSRPRSPSRARTEA